MNLCESILLPCPAKINLFLHVLGQRQDGYHNLQTVFQLLDIHDTLEITLTPNSSTIVLETEFHEVPAEQNLVFKAATLLNQQTGNTHGATLKLKKVLPSGGGLGGGSSDAATALVGLNYVWKTGLSSNELAELGRQLGADVPVFIHGNSAWGEGVGELLKPIELPDNWYLIIKPNCHVSTATIFSHKDLTRDTHPITVAAFLKGGGRNDCQNLVETLYPQVRDAVEWLSQFSSVMMTGTGACVFAKFPTKEAAEAVLANRPDYVQGFVAKGVNRSPLHQHLPQI